jgi:hypothetical protein
LKAGHGADNEAENGGFQGRRKKIAERNTIESSVNEVPQGDRLCESVGDPAHQNPARIGGESQQRQDNDAG